jgi:hypothetical protein
MEGRAGESGEGLNILDRRDSVVSRDGNTTFLFSLLGKLLF